MNELGNTPADKNYQPSGISKAEERALEAYPEELTTVYGPLPGASAPCIIDSNRLYRIGFVKGYEQAEKDTIALIESRLSEILGDAQPKPILRAELQELKERIKNNEITKSQGNI